MIFEQGDIVSLIFDYENEMWQAAKNGDNAAFSQLVSAEAVMVCGGYRCTGTEYADLIGNFGISDYQISSFEIVLETDSIVQTHYIVKTAADNPVNSDLAGAFHVTSTWEKKDKWRLIFNMDSRIMQEV